MLSQAELFAWARSVLLQERSRGLTIHAYEGTVDKPDEQPLPAGAIRLTDPMDFKRAVPIGIHRRADKPLPPLEAATSARVDV